MAVVSKPAQQLSPWGHALAGAMSAVFSNALVYPLDTLKTQIQASSSSSEKDPNDPTAPPPSPTLLSLLLPLFKNPRLIFSLYKGFLASMLNTFSMQYAYFFFYSVVRSLYVKRLTRIGGGRGGGPRAVGTVEELLLGALAGAGAQIFTIPVAVIATRQQLSKDNASFLAIGKEILDEDGPSGLWRGLRPGLVLTVNPAITFGGFERIKGLVLKRTGKDKLSPGMAFLVGAASKTLATVVTYPYIMAKVRLQAKTTSSSPTPSSTSTTTTSSLAPLPSESVGSASAPATSYADALKHKTATEGATTASTPVVVKDERYKDAMDVLKKVYKAKGFTGLYQGMEAQITKGVLAQGITFVLKDQFESYAYFLLLLLARTPTLPANVHLPSPSEAVGYAKATLEDHGKALHVAGEVGAIAGKAVVETIATQAVVGVLKA
ncbi:mitochondrial carrier domain-containing protein [Mrakia frigida]|uniref:mitochondrial carrier domain-containing protein n=1 Tax=Mrakia frigida TaxID=29902 RepID=UPI003FCC0E36